MTSSPPKPFIPQSGTRYAIIIPACNEESCLRFVIDDLRDVVDPTYFEIVVGINGTSDGTRKIAHQAGVFVAESEHRGYGHGCQAAIDLVLHKCPPVDAYIFFAADGANDPVDIISLVRSHQQGNDMVLGCRTTNFVNWGIMGFTHVIANRLLGFWCGCMSGTFFNDIGPLRLIEKNLFHGMQLREWVYGWTIEAQIRAVMLGARITEIPVSERKRISGEQKVSRVSWRHSLEVGVKIFMAGWRTRFRDKSPCPFEDCTELDQAARHPWRS